MLAVMKQNPWSTALGTIGVLGLVIAAVAYFVGVGMGLGGGGMLDFSRWLGQFAGLSLVGYFLYEAFEWLSIERRRVEAEARKRAADARS